MKLSNKFALISSLVSFTVGILLTFSLIFWTIPLEDYSKAFLFLIISSSMLTGGLYFYQETRLNKAIADKDKEKLFNTPFLCAVQAALNFSVFVFILLLISNSLFKITTTINIVKMGFLFIPVGLIQLSFIYYLGLYLLIPYYLEQESKEIKGLNISHKVLLLVIPAVIFSGLTGYVITKSLGGFLYILLPSLIIWLLIKTIKEPVNHLLGRLEYLLDDNLPVPEQKKFISGDEIANIDNALSVFLGKTDSSVFQINETLENVKTQGKAILSGIEREASSSKQIDYSVSDILASKEEIEAIIKSINKNNAKIESLSSEIESQIKTLINTSKKSIELANTGEEESEKGVSKINTFVLKIEEGSKSLQELSSAFEQIKEFNSLMEQISDDTNLLALNASIEATRKEGVESKGFSVIADEIRKLSNDSASYLEKTRENIKRMREAVRSIVESTEESKAIFEESKSIIQKTAEDLEQISESIGMTTNMANQISSILKEEADSTEGINKLTKKISSLNEKQVENALSLSKETEAQVASMEDTEIRVRTLISLIDKIKENSDIHLE